MQNEVEMNNNILSTYVWTAWAIYSPSVLLHLPHSHNSNKLFMRV